MRGIPHEMTCEAEGFIEFRRLLAAVAASGLNEPGNTLVAPGSKNLVKAGSRYRKCKLLLHSPVSVFGLQGSDWQESVGVGAVADRQMHMADVCEAGLPP